MTAIIDIRCSGVIISKEFMKKLVLVADLKIKFILNTSEKMAKKVKVSI